jgi:PHD/YefM family antitoxin component YafN of YafNO toxin-antitoxin module
MQIIPINQLKDTAKISAICNESNEPIFITKNGYGDMVIMSMKAYEEQQELSMLKDLKTKLDMSKALDGDKIMQRIKKTYVD